MNALIALVLLAIIGYLAWELLRARPALALPLATVAGVLGLVAWLSTPGGHAR